MSKSYFHVVKTDKNISDITNKVSDRLIITKSGKLYFDYDENTRLELSSNISGEGSRYNVYNSITPLYELNSNKSLKYTDITNVNGESVSEIIVNSLIFDKYGNYGIILEDHPEWQSVLVKVIGIITDYLKKDVFSNSDRILTNFVIAQEVENEIEFTISDLNINTNEITKNKYKVISSDGSILYNYNHEDKTIDIRTSLTREEVEKLISDINAMEYSGPYASINDIPTPYEGDKMYLIGTETPYDIYVYSDNQLILFGSTAVMETYDKDEIDEMIDDVQDYVDESIKIKRY